MATGNKSVVELDVRVRTGTCRQALATLDERLVAYERAYGARSGEVPPELREVFEGWVRAMFEVAPATSDAVVYPVSRCGQCPKYLPRSMHGPEMCAHPRAQRSPDLSASDVELQGGQHMPSNCPLQSRSIVYQHAGEED